MNKVNIALSSYDLNSYQKKESDCFKYLEKAIDYKISLQIANQARKSRNNIIETAVDLKHHQSLLVKNQTHQKIIQKRLEECQSKDRELQQEVYVNDQI